MNGAQGGPHENHAGARRRPPEPSGNGPRQDRRELTRAALLDAAHRLWAERGIHGASLDDIAGAAGLTKGAVYSNFTGKTDLLLALLDRYTELRASSEVCDELRDLTRRPADRIERAGEAYDRIFASDETTLQALLLIEFWLYGMRDYAAGWRIADWYAARRAGLAHGLREADDIPPQDRAALSVAMDIGLTFQHLLDPHRVPAGHLFGTGLRLILGPALP